MSPAKLECHRNGPGRFVTQRYVFLWPFADLRPWSMAPLPLFDSLPRSNEDGIVTSVLSSVADEHPLQRPETRIHR
jgi:hypothetical protein